jgi:hypothetical protein
MKAIQLLQAENTISRRKQRLQQELVFAMLVENIAFDKLVEVHWAGEDKVWHTLRAEHHSSGDTNREVWRAQATFNPSDDASLPGDVEFALPRSGRGLLGQQRIAQLLFKRRLRRVAGAERPVAQCRFQSDLACRATLLSDHGRRTPLPAAQAGLHSLDDGQLAQHAGYALLLL